MSDGNDLSRRELERQIQELRRDKVRLDDSIRKMEATQKRIFGEEERLKLSAMHSQEDKKEDGEEDDDDKDDKDEEKKDEEKKEEASEETRKRKREEDAEKREEG